MSTFFSGTDTATLKEEGTDRNNFVSLIVNNAGTYTAAITRRIKAKQVKESVSYEFFGDGEKEDTKEYTSDEDEIEWFYLEIEKEGENYNFPDMESRLEEIKKIKAEKAKNTPMYSGTPKTTVSSYFTTQAGLANLIEREDKGYENRTLFDSVDEKLPAKEEYYIPYDQVSFDKTIIKSLVLQLLTGSIIISNESKIDINKWAKSMPTLYGKRFGTGKEGMDRFKIWADTYTEYLTWYISDTKLEELGYDETEMCAICAHDMIQELTKLPENDYIKGYIDSLQKYLVL